MGTFLFLFSSFYLVYNPKLCFILDGFLGLYGLFITAMFVREKVQSSGPGSYRNPIRVRLPRRQRKESTRSLFLPETGAPMDQADRKTRAKQEVRSREKRRSGVFQNKICALTTYLVSFTTCTRV
uniref:T-cell surface glycoprotein CD3 zeta chain n=1 Tax=Neogobius melanostomus TaxID=47308 RepID=A0A8C6SQ62_9GOBI